MVAVVDEPPAVAAVNVVDNGWTVLYIGRQGDSCTARAPVPRDRSPRPNGNTSSSLEAFRWCRAWRLKPAVIPDADLLATNWHIQILLCVCSCGSIIDTTYSNFIAKPKDSKFPPPFSWCGRLGARQTGVSSALRALCASSQCLYIGSHALVRSGGSSAL